MMYCEWCKSEFSHSPRKKKDTYSTYVFCSSQCEEAFDKWYSVPNEPHDKIVFFDARLKLYYDPSAHRVIWEVVSEGTEWADGEEDPERLIKNGWITAEQLDEVQSRFKKEKTEVK